MILTDNDIVKAVRSGHIEIDGFDKKKLGSNSYDLTLGDILLIYTGEELDAKKDNPFKLVEIPREGYVIQPGELYLGVTAESTKTKVYIPCIEGKCFEKGTLVRMYDNSLKEIELIKVGDKVLGLDGNPKMVKSLHEGTADMYRIDQSKGQSYVVNGNHELSLYSIETTGKRFKKQGIYNLSVIEYLQLSKTDRASLRGYKSIAYFPSVNLPIPPYLLGVWLGDGCHENARLTINKDDTELIHYLMSEFPFMVMHNYKPGAYTINLSTELKTKFKRENKFLNLLRLQKLHGNKHIPDLYKRSSLSQRLELLAGLLDTDGYVNNACYEILLENHRLFKDAKDIAESCGFSCHTSIKEVNGKDYYRMTISGNVTRIPLKLSRKYAKLKKLTGRISRVYSKLTITPIGKAEYFGFELDTITEYDKLFFLKDYTVVHNSSIARLGISVHLTAGFGDVGFHGHWTLEITAQKPVRIYADMPICQIYYTLTLGDCTVPYSLKTDAKYHGQPGIPVSSKMFKNFKPEMT